MLYHSLLLSFAALASPTFAKASSCKAVSIPKPASFGIEIIDVAVTDVKNYTDSHYLAGLFHLPILKEPLDFCNVTVTYTHPNTGDTVNVFVWLPAHDAWNGRYLGQGGGGFLGGFEGSLVAGVGHGFAAANTDGGHSRFDGAASGWALKSPGNVDLQGLADFGSSSLDELTTIAKQVIKGYYGKKPDYSYWVGCSQGGRQGLIQAQRFPGSYDGILANAPAIDWSEFAVTMNWGQFQMEKEKYVPPPCEWTAIHAAAVEACDELDGVKDGIVSAPGLCKFDAQSAVGRPCCDGKRKVSKKAATIANLAYTGMNKDHTTARLGLGHSMVFASEVPEMQHFGGLLQTTCDEKNEKCKRYPFNVPDEWLRYFVARDPDLDVASLTEDDMYRLLRISMQQYSSLLNADWADLSEFKAAGSKMITWHGLNDQLLHPDMTQQYYEKVLAIDPKAADYYRYFEAPGIEHCAGGDGFFPTDIFKKLQNWVEKGEAPDTLVGATVTAINKGLNTRPLCPYPSVARYIGGDPKAAASFKCAADFGKKKASWEEDAHSEL